MGFYIRFHQTLVYEHVWMGVFIKMENFDGEKSENLDSKEVKTFCYRFIL